MRWLGALLLAVAGCSLLVDDNVDEVRCRDEGVIGPPACDVGEVCASGRCRTCIATDVCGDGVDNDCTGLADEGCPAEGDAG